MITPVLSPFRSLRTRVPKQVPALLSNLLSQTYKFGYEIISLHLSDYLCLKAYFISLSQTQSEFTTSGNSIK